MCHWKTTGDNFKIGTVKSWVRIYNDGRSQIMFRYLWANISTTTENWSECTPTYRVNNSCFGEPLLFLTLYLQTFRRMSWTDSDTQYQQREWGLYWNSVLHISPSISFQHQAVKQPLVNLWNISFICRLPRYCRSPNNVNLRNWAWRIGKYQHFCYQP